ncbi:MAG: hypothetical protein ACOVOR_01475 [Rhabdochlamydiaceae bacterium]
MFKKSICVFFLFLCSPSYLFVSEKIEPREFFELAEDQEYTLEILKELEPPPEQEEVPFFDWVQKLEKRMVDKSADKEEEIYINLFGEFSIESQRMLKESIDSSSFLENILQFFAFNKWTSYLEIGSKNINTLQKVALYNYQYLLEASSFYVQDSDENILGLNQIFSPHSNIKIYPIDSLQSGLEAVDDKINLFYAPFYLEQSNYLAILEAVDSVCHNFFFMVVDNWQLVDVQRRLIASFDKFDHQLLSYDVKTKDGFSVLVLLLKKAKPNKEL